MSRTMTAAFLAALSGGAVLLAASQMPPPSGPGRQGVVTAPSSKHAASVVWKVDNLETIAGHSVRVIGTPRVVQTEIGKVVEFNGKTDGLFVEANPVANLNTFTVEVVLQPAKEGVEEQRFLHISEVGSENRLMMETRLLPGAVWSLDTYLKSGDASRALLDRLVTHPAGTWHVVALTYDGKTMTHVVDGTTEMSGPVDFKPLGPGPTSIGVRQNLVSWFSGRIAEVRVTASVLSSRQMLTVNR
jgi:hypothetical protein